MPGPLAPEDLVGYLDEHGEDWVLANFVASEGPMVLMKGFRVRVPSITPRLTKRGCVFYDAGCVVHGSSPFGCSHLDTHMGAEEADERSVALVKAQMKPVSHGGVTDIYKYIWDKLMSLGHEAKPLKKRLKQYNILTKKEEAMSRASNLRRRWRRDRAIRDKHQHGCFGGTRTKALKLERAREDDEEDEQ